MQHIWLVTRDQAVGPTGNPDLDETGPRELKPCKAERHAEPHVAMTSSSGWQGRSDLCSPITARAWSSRNAPAVVPERLLGTKLFVCNTECFVLYK